MILGVGLGMVLFTFQRNKDESIHEQEQFRNRWLSILETVKSPVDFDADTVTLAENKVIRTFPDNSWIAVVSHNIHEGGEWDRTLLKDSTGAVWQSSHHFCGYEGLHGEIFSVEGTTLKQFHQNARHLGFEAKLHQ